MLGLAVIDRGWGLRGSLEQWRRITGVLRTDLASRPLYEWVHPDDAVALARMWEMSQRGAWTERVRVGHYGSRAVVDLELGPWSREGLAVVLVRAVESPPIRSWWLPFGTFVRRSTVPTAVQA